MPDPLGYQPLIRWTGLLAGNHLWKSTPEDPGQLVRIDIEEGESYATVLDGEDEGEVHRTRDMGGEFERV